MGELTIELAESPAEVAAVRDLCRSFRQWLYDNYPQHRSVVDLYYNPQKRFTKDRRAQSSWRGLMESLSAASCIKSRRRALPR